MKGKEVEEDKKNTIVCRCEDIAWTEVEAAVTGGITDPEELKRFLHVGMGPCQGRTCGRLTARIIAQKTGKDISNLKSTGQRPPLISVPIREFLGDRDE